MFSARDDAPEGDATRDWPGGGREHRPAIISNIGLPPAISLPAEVRPHVWVEPVVSEVNLTEEDALRRTVPVVVAWPGADSA